MQTMNGGRHDLGMPLSCRSYKYLTAGLPGETSPIAPTRYTWQP